MTALTLTVVASVISTLVSVLTAGAMVRFHCRQDDQKRGAQDERSRVNTERIEQLERLQRGER
jgi:heme/copper-type cytochrome/quinol oxidase subunit 2